MLEALDIFWSEGIGCVLWNCELELCSIVWFGMSIGELLRFCWLGLTELVDHIDYVP